MSQMREDPIVEEDEGTPQPHPYSDGPDHDDGEDIENPPGFEE